MFVFIVLFNVLLIQKTCTKERRYPGVIESKDHHYSFHN